MSDKHSVKQVGNNLLVDRRVLIPVPPPSPVKIKPTVKAPLSKEEMLELKESYEKAMEENDKEEQALKRKEKEPEVIDLDDTEETTDEEPVLSGLNKKLADNNASFRDIDDAYSHVKIINHPDEIPDCVFEGMKKRKIADRWFDCNNISQALIIQRMIRDSDCAELALESLKNCMECLYKFCMDDLTRLMNSGVKYHEKITGDNVQRLCYLSLMLNQIKKTYGDVKNLTQILSDRWEQANSIALNKHESKYEDN